MALWKIGISLLTHWRCHSFALSHKIKTVGLWLNYNKANLRDLIAATGLVISNWIQIVNFPACVTMKFDGWPPKTIGHFFYTTSSFVHHFKSISEFKLELQSGNTQFGSKSMISWAAWPWNLADDLKKTRQIWGIWKLRPAYSPEMPNLGQIGDVLSRVTLKFDGWPWKTIGHLCFAVSSFVQHFIAIGEFKLELQSGNAQFGSTSTIFRAVWPWNLTYDIEKQ